MRSNMLWVRLFCDINDSCIRCCFLTEGNLVYKRALELGQATDAADSNVLHMKATKSVIKFMLWKEQLSRRDSPLSPRTQPQTVIIVVGSITLSECCFKDVTRHNGGK